MSLNQAKSCSKLYNLSALIGALVMISLKNIEEGDTICATIKKPPLLHHYVFILYIETFKYALLIHNGHEVAQLVTCRKLGLLP